uniref:Uncharacterized protein n=1 Tax=Arundo donax TaxID=35708 RepID=A0A0A8YTD2_ARUDO
MISTSLASRHPPAPSRAAVHEKKQHTRNRNQDPSSFNSSRFTASLAGQLPFERAGARKKLSAAGCRGVR